MPGGTELPIMSVEAHYRYLCSLLVYDIYVAMSVNVIRLAISRSAQTRRMDDLRQWQSTRGECLQTRNNNEPWIRRIHGHNLVDFQRVITSSREMLVKGRKRAWTRVDVVA